MPNIRATIAVNEQQKEWFDYHKDVLRISYASLIFSKLPRTGIALNQREKLELAAARRKAKKEGK